MCNGTVGTDQQGCSGYVGLQTTPSNSLLAQAHKSSLASGWAWGAVELPEPHQDIQDRIELLPELMCEI